MLLWKWIVSIENFGFFIYSILVGLIEQCDGVFCVLIFISFFFEVKDNKQRILIIYEWFEVYNVVFVCVVVLSYLGVVGFDSDLLIVKLELVRNNYIICGEVISVIIKINLW